MKLVSLSLFGAVLLAAASGARAVPIAQYQLAIGNPGISSYPGPYADVTVSLDDPTTATITFSSNSVGGYTYLFGDGSSVAVNVNATSWTLGSVSGSNGGTGFLPATFSDGGGGQVDGWGNFNQTITSSDGFTNSSDVVSFTITNTSGTWSSATDVLSPVSESDSVAAAHIFVCTDTGNGTCDQGAGALATGFAAVPEPSTWLLLGSGLGGLAVFGTRKRTVS